MENKKPQVSVIIPAYNQARYLGEAIQSVLSQTYDNFEIIVVDDGSTDDTPLVANQYRNKIRYIRQSNQGLSGARNTGIRNSNSEFIALLDSDDQWLPNYLQKMVDLVTHFPEGDVFYCQACSIDANGDPLDQIFGGPALRPKEMYNILLRLNFLNCSTILMKRSAVIKVGLFDQSLRSCEDWDLWLRLLPEHIFIGTSACLVKFRLHNASLSMNLEGMHKAARLVIEKNFGSEDGDPKYWTLEKRRAYGGLYRYQALTSILRNDNWQVASQFILRGLRADPTLSLDLGLFYDLALGSQPVGLRGTSQYLDINKNALRMNCMLEDVFRSSVELKKIHRSAYGTAYYALGLVAYNTGKPNLCRKYLLKAVSFRPTLIYDFRLMGDLLKSNINPALMKRLRRLRGAGFKIFEKKNNKLKV